MKRHWVGRREWSMPVPYLLLFSCWHVTPVSACHPCDRLSPRVHLSPLCPPVTTGPPVTPVSACRHCAWLSPLVQLSPLCPSVTTVFACHPCVWLSPLCSQHWRTRSQRSDLSIHVHCCPQFWALCSCLWGPVQIHSLQWMPLFSSVANTTSASLRIGLPTPIPPNVFHQLPFQPSPLSYPWSQLPLCTPPLYFQAPS